MPEEIFVDGGEMGALMRSRFACAEGNTNCSQALLSWVEICRKAYKLWQPIRLILPAWFDRQFNGVMG